MNKLDEANNKKAITFFRAFVRSVLKGKFQVIQFGFWNQGKGKYGLSMSWGVPEELDES